MIKRVPGLGSALTLAIGLSGLLVMAAILAPRPSSTLVFPVDHSAGFSPASRPQSIQPMGASITPITSVAAGSSGISFSGDAYDVSCTVSAAAGTLYPAMHDGTNWTVYYAYPCALDGTVATKATCIFPARRGSGLTWNAFKTGAATINACTAEQRYTGGGLSAVPPPPASSAAAFDPASPGAIGGTTPAAGTFTGLTSPSLAPSGAVDLDITAGDDLLLGSTLGEINANGGQGIRLRAAGTLIADVGITAADALTIASGKKLYIGSAEVKPAWDATATLSTSGIGQTVLTISPDTGKESTYEILWQAHKTSDRTKGNSVLMEITVYFSAGNATIAGTSTEYTHSWGGSTYSVANTASGATVLVQVTSDGASSEHKVSYRLLQDN